MRKFWFIALALGIVLALSGSVAINSSAESNSLRGDYVETRTASVFAGACHYNGELTTTGRDALMAWNVVSGSWRGVDLAGSGLWQSSAGSATSPKTDRIDVRR